MANITKKELFAAVAELSEEATSIADREIEITIDKNITGYKLIVTTENNKKRRMELTPRRHTKMELYSIVRAISMFIPLVVFDE